MTYASVIPATRETIHSLDETPFFARRALELCLRLAYGELTMTLPSGQRLHFDAPQEGVAAEMEIHDWRCLRKVLTGGALGFAEGYVEGDWTTRDLPRLLQMFSANFEKWEAGLNTNWLFNMLTRLQHMARSNSKRQAEKNIHAHYDLGNAFYSRWLDPSMTYSSALYEHEGQDLEAAQRNKYRALADSIALKEGDHVLEIGCGWGGFAEYAAKERGAKVTGITISKEQLAFAQERMQRCQLNDKVNIEYTDYRDVQGRFDAVASIEMFEAVGQEYWNSYFGKIAEVLKPGGRAGLQIITIKDEIFDGYQKSVDFIQKYIFPGGMLPSVEKLKDEFSKAELFLDNTLEFGHDYADTLAEWRIRFERVWDEIAHDLDFDERFRRLWNYYLAYCEAGFRTERINVGQFSLIRA